MKALRKLFLNELADLYDSEQRIAKALPKVIKAATCEKLQQALQNHLSETEEHAARCEKIFEAFGEKPRARKCPAMAGILEEGEQIISENKKSPAINAAIIYACQKVEHYEIASYGALRTWAELLGNEAAADAIEEILDQEKEADHVLNELSGSKNQEALSETETVGAVAEA